MTFLRSLLHDLVDKKLWPLAAILAAALVAVPVVLGGGGEPAAPVVTPSSPVPASIASVPPSSAEVAVAVEQPGLRRRKGRTRDPFKQQYTAKVATTVAPSKPAATSAPATSTGDSGKSGATAAPDPPSTTVAPTPPAAPAAPELDPLDVYRVSVRFGEPGKQKSIRDIARLSPMPNADFPFFVLLGVLSGGKKAVFLISSDAVASGDGICRPSKVECETVELKKGQTEFFDRQTDRGVVQYQLDLVTLKRRSAEEQAAERRLQAARAARRKKSSAKRPASKVKSSDEAGEDLGTDIYRWDARRGVLVRRRATTSQSVGSVTTEPPVIVGAP